MLGREVDLTLGNPLPLLRGRICWRVLAKVTSWLLMQCAVLDCSISLKIDPTFLGRELPECSPIPIFHRVVFSPVRSTSRSDLFIRLCEQGSTYLSPKTSFASFVQIFCGVNPLCSNRMTYCLYPSKISSYSVITNLGTVAERCGEGDQRRSRATRLIRRK